jgi:protocatechuate 3,4-dioxygenase beta subunit
MKPIGRPVEIPSVRVLPQFGAVTGTVAQAETGDALEGAVVNLMQNNDAKPQTQLWRYTDSNGGFAFDSVAPGGYQLRIRRIGEYQDTLTIHTVADRADTVRFRMRAYRCYGY